MMTVAVSFLSC